MKVFFSILAILFLSTLLCNAQDDNCTCCSENHKAFDFWVGEWEVANLDGSIAGINVVEKVEGLCMLRENWTGTSGSTGTSMNFFNLKTRQWEQLWVDNSGAHLKLKGNRVGNQMVLSSDEFVHTDGKNYMNRITWTKNDDGTVRQLWEIVGKDDFTKVLFDGLYTKVK